jgi:hypothetical protein
MPQTCPQCQREAADDANNCPNCGAALATTATGATPPPAAPAGAGAPAAVATTGSSLPAYKFDAERWSLADRIAGVATVVLFISLFLPWFTYSAGFGGFSVSFSVNGLWHGWMYLTLIISIALIAYLVLRAGWDRLPVSQEIPHVSVMLGATVINLVLTLIAFIDKPGGGGVGWGFGAIIGLISAAAAAAPYAVPQLRAKTM